MKQEGWNRPHELQADGGNDVLEVCHGAAPSLDAWRFSHGCRALDGERILRLKPVFGYLHRNHEKIAEGASYLASMPYTDRLDYFCSLTNNWAYALAVEKLAGLQVPERAEYLRVILAELVDHIVVVFVGVLLVHSVTNAGHMAYGRFEILDVGYLSRLVIITELNGRCG